MLAEVGIGLAKKFVNFSLPNSVASSQLCFLITTYSLHMTPVASLIFKKIFYLIVSGLSCGIQDL